MTTLLTDTAPRTAHAAGFLLLPPGDIQEDLSQPRHEFPSEEQDALAESIAASEVAVPLLVMPERDGGDAAYAYLPAHGSAWQGTRSIGGMRQVNSWLSLLERAVGSLRRFVLLNSRDDHDVTHLTILWSDDSQHWERQPLETGRSFADEQIVATSLLVVPRGAGLIAAAWAQTPGPGHARGGAFAVISTDGGSSWSWEEIIAQHFDDGRLFDDDGRGLPGGFEPALVYDATTDRVVASWVEEDIARRGEQYGAHMRTFLASRSLAADATWQDVITPDRGAGMPPPLLADWGLRGALWGMPSGRRHWLITVDERNDQHRVAVRPLRLSALLDAGQSEEPGASCVSWDRDRGAPSPADGQPHQVLRHRTN